jgi:serine/threonine protein kinase
MTVSRDGRAPPAELSSGDVAGASVVRGADTRPRPELSTPRRQADEVASRALFASPRFEVRRKLGEGGMGVVYEALDRERGELVAVKTMSRADPSLIYQFKQEFRALADVAHPNLAVLHELLSIDGEWMLTMELVEGTSFLGYVREAREAEPGEATASITSAPTPLPTMTAEELSRDLGGAASAPAPPPPAQPRVSVRLPVHVPRLRSALRQLVLGLAALHAAGKLHRDIKPPNVLVTRDGRVVVLDFGLVTELAARPGRALDDAIAGTPAYMAPEHIAGVPLTAAADWYSVGAMLYETLTGTLPFVQSDESLSYAALLRLKQMFDPEPPTQLAPHVDPQLSELCLGLLRREPEERLGAGDVLAFLDGVRPRAPAAPSAEPASQDAPLLGREAHLDALAAALARVGRREAVAVYVHGVSGMGKTAVVRRFLDEVARRGEAIVLEGRCYERESVPYKALDSLIDALSAELSRLTAVEAALVLPRNTVALARIFPVLGRVPAIALAPRPELEIPDPLELRRAAFAALRELLSRLGDRRPLLLAIDDLQWGDVDSARLLEGLLLPPDPPPIMLVLSYRDGDPATDHARSLLPRPPGGGVVDLEVGPLGDEEARALVLASLARRDPRAMALASTIVRESGKIPLLLHELARYVEEDEGGTRHDAAAWSAADPSVTFDEVLGSRVSRLPDDARRLLDVVAIAARPIAVGLARRASGLAPDDQAALAALRAAHVVRVSRARDHDEVEAFHDRVREAVTRRMPPDLARERHLRLAQELEATGGADAEALATHWRGAGDLGRAASAAIVAAAEARQALAFDRAARLCRFALDLLPESDARREGLHAKLGDALANAGRCAEASAAFLVAARTAPPSTSLELRRRAGEQLLISGHIDEGLEVLGGVLGAAGLSLPLTPARALARLLLGRAYLALRGLRTTPRDERDVPQDELTRVDVCWAAAIGLAMVDNIRGAYFQTRHMMLALRCGEPYRVARALAMEVGYRATAGRSGRRSAEKLSRVATAMAQRIGVPHTIGLTTVTAGMTSYLQGRWREGYELIARGELVFREQCSGVVSERTNATLFALRCLLYLGELAEVTARVPALIEEAHGRGDLYATTYLRLRYAYLAHLAADDLEGARETVTVASQRWSRQGFHIQHYLDVFAQAEIELYAGRGAAAWELLERRLPEIRRSLVLRVQHLRVETLYLHGRAALAAARGAAPREARALVASADRDRRKLAHERVLWADALGHALGAGVAHARGDGAAARRRCDRAIEGLEGAEMALHAASLRRAKGLATGGAAGDALVAEADRVLAAQRIRSPARWAEMTAAGLAPARGDTPAEVR